jgi:hypothetical protein
MGGESPVIGDPLYMSIAAEMIEPTGIKQGKYWITRIPTTLTILQCGSTWNNLIRNVAKFINDFGGKTTIMKPEIIISDFKPFVEDYKSKTPVKTVGNINQFKLHEK